MGRQKETGSYYLKLDWCDMVTLCIDRVEDRSRGSYYLNWIWKDDILRVTLGQRTITFYFSRVESQERTNVETASSERPSAAHSA